ncbi:hypothetical protein C9374_010233 [Naegleria lovaniensis]|uniref:Regulator of chromosome condensation domain-containing protein n=1 Tax=Naegleria lovaniensis TaxID=51637 RepID=A0AA88GGI0_NAELO|nr:uncharacterized protein C9374_010233 [Naegleria lovaniensis]KAG2374859.1 hypothetical protein C9374_010233 [Naegleria lovaniensis]
MRDRHGSTRLVSSSNSTSLTTTIMSFQKASSQQQPSSSPPLKYLFYKINHLSKLNGSSTLVVTLPSNQSDMKMQNSSHSSRHEQFLVPMDDHEYDDYILYNDDDGGDGGDDTVDDAMTMMDDQYDDDHQLLLIGVKNEFRDVMDVSRIKCIFSENESTFIVMEDDSIWVAGSDNSNYQLGLGHNQPLTQIPTLIPSFTSHHEKIKKISILIGSTVFLTENGNVYACGIDYYTSDYHCNANHTINHHHVFSSPTLIFTNIQNISSHTQDYLVMITKDFELMICGRIKQVTRSMMIESHGMQEDQPCVITNNTRPITFPGSEQLSSHHDTTNNNHHNATNNNHHNATNTNHHNNHTSFIDDQMLPIHFGTCTTLPREFVIKISCHGRSLMILTNLGNIYVYGENTCGKFGIIANNIANSNDSNHSEFIDTLTRQDYFQNQSLQIIDIECSDRNCYFLTNCGTVYCSGEFILLTHYVTELLHNDLFIADRGKIMKRNGSIVSRYVSQYYNEFFYRMDHFDFLIDGKIITVLKSAIYPMDIFSKAQLLDPYFVSHSIASSVKKSLVDSCCSNDHHGSLVNHKSSISTNSTSFNSSNSITSTTFNSTSTTIGMTSNASTTSITSNSTPPNVTQVNQHSHSKKSSIIHSSKSTSKLSEITYKKLLDFFNSLSLYQMILGDYDLKHFESYFKASSSDAYNAQQIQLQQLWIDKYTFVSAAIATTSNTSSNTISNTSSLQEDSFLRGVKQRLKEFLTTHHSNLISSHHQFYVHYIHIKKFFQNATTINELIFTLMICFEKNITVAIEAFIQNLQDTILQSVNEDRHDQYGGGGNIPCSPSSVMANSTNMTLQLLHTRNKMNMNTTTNTTTTSTTSTTTTNTFFSTVPSNYDELHKMVIDAFGLVDRKQLPPPATFGRKKIAKNDGRLLGFGSAVGDQCVDDCHEFGSIAMINDKYYSYLSQKPVEPFTFVFVCGILAAIKLLLKSDRVKTPDAKISKDELIAFQTSMNAIRDHLREHLEFNKTSSSTKKKPNIVSGGLKNFDSFSIP